MFSDYSVALGGGVCVWRRDGGAHDETAGTRGLLWPPRRLPQKSVFGLADRTLLLNQTLVKQTGKAGN